MKKGFGTLLTIDAYKCKREKIDSIEYAKQFLDRFPEKIEMVKITEPLVTRWKGSGWDKGGVSGFVMIAQSHVSLHSFPQSGFLTADLYSSMEFDVKKVVKEFREAFEAAEVDYMIIKRGKEFVKE